MEKDNDSYEDLLFETPRQSGIEIRLALLKTLSCNESFSRCFHDIQTRIETGKINKKIDIDNEDDLKELVKQFISIYDPNFKEEEINIENFKESLEIIRKEFKKEGINVINLKNMDDFFTFYSLYISTVHQGMMRIKLINNILLDLPKTEFKKLEKMSYNLKDILSLAEENPEIKKSLSGCIFEIFIDTGGFDFWIKNAYEKVKKENNNSIDFNKVDITTTAENAFNSYLEDLFGMKIPGFKVIDIGGFEEQDHLKEDDDTPSISGFDFLFLSNQLPS